MMGVDIRTVQELMGHSTVNQTMRHAHLSPAHLRDAVNKASLGPLTPKNLTETGSKTGSTEEAQRPSRLEEVAEGVETQGEANGGAGRVRTAASQFCRLLP